MTRLLRFIVPAVAVLGLAAGGLTGCETFPSGCVRFTAAELPYPYVWNAPSGAVMHYHDLPVQQTFVGVSGTNPQINDTGTWHGPSNFTGWAEYASARNCYESGGAYAGG